MRASMLASNFLAITKSAHELRTLGGFECWIKPSVRCSGEANCPAGASRIMSWGGFSEARPQGRRLRALGPRWGALLPNLQSVRLPLAEQPQLTDVFEPRRTVALCRPPH